MGMTILDYINKILFFFTNKIKNNQIKNVGNNTILSLAFVPLKCCAQKFFNFFFVFQIIFFSIIPKFTKLNIVKNIDMFFNIFNNNWLRKELAKFFFTLSKTKLFFLILMIILKLKTLNRVDWLSNSVISYENITGKLVCKINLSSPFFQLVTIYLHPLPFYY